MKRPFLIGRFLPSYSLVYRHANRPVSPEAGLHQDVLERRFSERALRFRERIRSYGMTLRFSAALALAMVMAAFHLPLHSGDIRELYS